MVTFQQTAQILDGKTTANAIRDELKLKIDEHVASGKRRPGLAVLLIGDDPASKVYVRNKVQACKKAGIESFLYEFSTSADEKEVLHLIGKLNDDQNIDGILVQLPLPLHLPTEKILDSVRPDKDVDGLHPENLGKLVCGKKGLRPCTPEGVMVLLERYGIEVAGKHAVVVGRSNLVGKPIALMLLEKHATVTMCHSKTKNLPSVIGQADILVVACGRAEMVRGAWVAPGAVVVDVGINRIEGLGDKGELVGDVDFQGAQAKASYITPVPGGVGPMTVAMLLSNTFSAYQEHLGRDR